MNQQDFDFLATYEGVWRNYLKDNTCKELGNNPSHLALMNQICIRNGIEPANLGCGNCIPKMFERLMKRYDIIKAERTQDQSTPEEPKTEPIKIKIESKKRNK